MSWRVLGVAALALVLICACRTQAQELASTAVNLYIIDPIGVPIAHARILVFIPTSLADVATDDFGHTFLYLRGGNYDVSARAPGYKGTSANFDLKSARGGDSDRENVILVLHPDKPAWPERANLDDSLSPTALVPIDKLSTVQDSDEYAVWSAVLAAKYDSGSYQRLVVKDRTEIAMPETVATQWRNSEHDNESFSDLQANNKTEYALENKFNVKLPCILFSREAENQLFPLKSPPAKTADFFREIRSAWNKFYEQYPGAQGILTISRVGFNSDKSQAMVYMTNQASLVIASGKVFLLVKKNGSWVIQSEVMLWLS